MADQLTIKLHGGPYDGDSFTGTIDSDVGPPTEFGLTAGTWQHLYRVNSAGEWHYHGYRNPTAFVSVEEIERVEVK